MNKYNINAKVQVSFDDGLSTRYYIGYVQSIFMAEDGIKYTVEFFADCARDFHEYDVTAVSVKLDNEIKS
jgi:hypothetical protein